jgi:glutamine synthetase
MSMVNREDDMSAVDGGRLGNGAIGRTHAGGRIDLETLRHLARSGEIETVLCVMPDLWGRLVGKRVAVKSFLETVLGKEGLHASLYLFVVDMDMDPRPGYAMTSWEDGFRDCRLVPDLDTLRVLPWLDRTAIVICDPADEHTGELVEVAPRVILKRQLERYRKAGLSVMCATELEFFLYADDYRSAWDRRYRDLRPVSYYRSDYHILQSTKDDWFLKRLRDAMNAADIEVEFSKSEWGLGQQEVNLRYAEALEMADRHALYKNGVKELTALAGMSASFMAKPRIDEIGSSCHVHLSLWDEDGGRPLMPGEGDQGMSELFRRFIAGQVAHGRDLTVLIAPNINSYKRFQINQFAGMSLAWGIDNRTCGLRVVGQDASLRLEHRIPGADANPYLAIAALAAAGLAGIEGELECPEPLTGNAADHPECPRVGRDLAEALALFEASELPRRAFGDLACEHLANFFRQELEAFNHETVTDWELIRYFERV